MSKKIAIVGAGGFGREIQMLIHQINNENNEWDFIGFYDDDPNKKVNASIIGDIQSLNKISEELNLIIAIGNPAIKKKILKEITNNKINYPVLIHPRVNIKNGQNIKIEEGTVICEGSILTTDITIGAHVIINLACTIGHDAIIRDYCAFMPSVNISGEVIINEAVYMGTGAKVINQVEIGENTVIGAGAVVTSSLPANCTAVGVPAKPVKFS